MMKVKVNSNRDSGTVVQQCPYCSGPRLQVNLSSTDTSKSCFTCKQSREIGHSKRKGGKEGILPRGVSVVEVSNKIISRERSNKTPSLFGRLFSRNRGFAGSNSQLKNSNGFTVDFSRQFQPPVTFLEIRSAPKLTSSNPNLDRTFPADDALEEYSNDVRCTMCYANPAQLSVTDSKGGKTERLCSVCRDKRASRSFNKHLLSTESLNLDSPTIKRSTNAGTKNTIIVINDGKGSSSLNPFNPQEETNTKHLNSEGANEKLLQILEDFKSTFLNSGSTASNQDFNHVSGVSQSDTAKSDSKPLSNQNLSVSTKSDSELNEKGGLPVTVLSFHNNKVNMLKRSSTTTGNLLPEQKMMVPFQPNHAPIYEVRESRMYLDPLAEGEASEEFERPAPYNPDYRSTIGKASIMSFRMPSELEAVGPYRGMANDRSKVEEALITERSRSSANHVENEFVTTSRNDAYTESNANDPDSNRVCFLKSFGRFSDISTQPGGFSNPTTLKLSRNLYNYDVTKAGRDSETLVVTDPRLSNVQVFDSKGECLALVKIEGIKSCCPIASRQLAVATDGWLAIFDYNGTEKVKATLDVDKGVLNSIAPSRNGISSVIVAQAKMVSIFDCSSSVRLIKKVERVNQKVQFENIVDVTTTSKENLVVLDSGVSNGSGAIFVIDISTGRPKSAIYPGLELCGSLLKPTAVAVDRHNQILVADSGNCRVLLFSNTRTSTTATQRKNSKRSDIQVSTLIDFGLCGSTGNELRLAGMDINDDNLIFLILKGEKKAGVRIYSRC